MARDIFQRTSALVSSAVETLTLRHGSSRRFLILLCGSACASLMVLTASVTAQTTQAPPADIPKIVGELQTAINAYEQDPSPENLVRVATWRLMVAEIATEGGDQMSLWSTAADEFDQGQQQLQALENQIAQAPEMERELSKIPAVAMRLDAARVRQEPIARRQALARDAERARLNQLRSIARAYRELLQKMAQADLELRMGDYKAASESNQQVLKSISAAYDVAAERKDYYLFDDEPEIGPDSDFQVIQALAPTLHVDIVSHAKAMLGLAAVRMALADEDRVDAAQLSEARRWALASLQGEAGGGAQVPAGHDENNPIGHYVMALVEEAQGLEMTRANPADAALHQQAASHFAAARKYFSQASAALTAADVDHGTLANLGLEIQNCRQRLEDASGYQRQADAATLAGNPTSAWAILAQAVLRHRQVSLWLAYLEAGRRGRVPAEQLQTAISQALREGMIKGDDAAAQTVLAKAVADVVWRDIGDHGAARLSPARREVLGTALAQRTAALRKAMPLEKSQVDRAQAQAILALLVSYQTVLAPAANVQQDRLREAHRMARDAMAVLEPDLDKQPDSMLRIAMREGLIAARLAYGHVAMQALPKYRDDALLSLAAAFDEMAKLPFHDGDLKIMGSPMITAMSGRSANSDTKLAYEERRYRELVTRFLEGMFTLHFGDAGAAADQMETALRQGEQSGGDPGEDGPRDAAAMLGQTDGFDSQVTLHDSVRAFKILADVKADRSETALLDCIALLAPESRISTVAELDEKTLQTAVQRIQSPLVGFALTSALESYIASLPVDVSPRRDMLLEQTSTALQRTGEQLASRRMQNRYPHLAAAVEQSQARLSSVEQYRTETMSRRSSGDLAGALLVVTEGLKRHPRSGPLWQLYFENQIEQARRRGAANEDYDQLLRQTTSAAAAGMITPYQLGYFQAVLYELQGRVQNSLTAYERALASAEAPQDRIRARAKVSELRVRLASSGR